MRTLTRASGQQTRPDVLPAALRLYLQAHRFPELSGAERRTAAALARHLHSSGLAVTTGIGGHGVVGRLYNGDGPTVLLRAELDALPLAERTGLTYASQVVTPTATGRDTPVMHACGHDLHLAALAGAAATLAADRSTWRGTLLVVGQPAEETLQGAAAMLADGLYERWGRPTVALAQHCAPLPAGMLAHGEQMTAACTTLRITIVGSGGHTAVSQQCVDAAQIAAGVVTQLPGIRAQLLDPGEPAQLSVGRLEAGTGPGTVADLAEITLTLRAMSPGAVQVLQDGVRRTVAGACLAAGATVDPQVEVIAEGPANRTDPAVAQRLWQAHQAAFGTERLSRWPGSLAAEDFGRFAADDVPTGYWMFGMIGPDRWRAAGGDPARRAARIPGNHSAEFAPCVRLALPHGIQSLVSAARAWLAAE